MESMTLVPGVEIGSGSLGHGLGLAVGTALGLRLTRRTDSRVVVLLGDAELEEGSNAEAIQFAGRTRLDQLTAVVIDNDSAGLGGQLSHQAIRRPCKPQRVVTLADGSDRGPQPPRQTATAGDDDDGGDQPKG